jgi:hypothetical protein
VGLYRYFFECARSDTNRQTSIITPQVRRCDARHLVHGLMNLRTDNASSWQEKSDRQVDKDISFIKGSEGTFTLGQWHNDGWLHLSLILASTRHTLA